MKSRVGIRGSLINEAENDKNKNTPTVSNAIFYLDSMGKWTKNYR